MAHIGEKVGFKRQTMAEQSRVAPLIRHDGDKGWRVCEEGAALLREIKEPVVVIAIAGLYRTGKSFLLNCIIGATGAKPALSVGSTSESCTRGIDLCVTPRPLESGARLVLLDTEGLASMEQDEAYDAQVRARASSGLARDRARGRVSPATRAGFDLAASLTCARAFGSARRYLQVFALALLLSSYFVLNSMGVLDEAAIDRLYLISELSKHVCVRTDAAAAVRADEVPALAAGTAAEPDAAREADLAQFFPPLLWVLRDFVVELVADGKPISQDEYMDKALEARPSSARRADERNRVRAAIRNLFPSRACVTLVRPAADEDAVRHAVSLDASELRPEFVRGMRDIQRRLLGEGGSGAGARVKKLFGAELNGAHLAGLASQYVRALNTDGVVPSIKGAWEYVVADACREAREGAVRAHAAALADALRGAAPDAAPVRELEPLLLAVAAPSAVGARARFRQAAIAGAEAEATMGALEAELAGADAHAVAQLNQSSRALCADAAERLCGALERALLADGASDGAPAPPAELARALRAFGEGFGAEASGPGKAGALADALRTRLTAAVEAYARALDARARDAAAAAAAERASVELRLATAEANLEARTTALQSASAERDAQRDELGALRAQLADERAARATAQAESASAARAHAAELAAARTELGAEREKGALLLEAARAEAGREAARATDAARTAEATLADAREQLRLARAEQASRDERALAAQREADAALGAARAAADAARADTDAVRVQTAALVSQFDAVRA
jgi:hypothetical protein